MEEIKLFEEIFGENIFIGRKIKEKSDRRLAAYAFMKIEMGIKNGRIALLTGRNHSTVHLGIKRFTGLIQSGDKDAINLWVYINERANDIIMR